MASLRPPPTDAGLLDVVDAYDGVLFDAFGVLLTHAGAVKGAAQQLRALDERGVRWLVVTNDASRHPERAAAWYRELGLPVAQEQVVSSGALLGGWIARHHLGGRPVLVLGTPDSARMIEEGGAHPVTGDEPFDAAAICDEEGYPLLAGLENVLNHKLRALERGEALPIALANPDLVYPQSPSRLGIAAGAVASMLEVALRARWSGPGPLLEPLGKPHRPVFDEAKRRLGSERLLMVGDQLATDVKGALDAGLDAALVGSGVAVLDHEPGEVTPTYLFRSWGG